LIVERNQSDDLTPIEINQNLPGKDGVSIRDLIWQHLSTGFRLASKPSRVWQDYVVRRMSGRG
jgi:hypothetical protein